MKKNNYSLRSSVKFFFALMIILSAFHPAKAFVSGYTFTSSTANYTAITGTTLFTGAWDDGVSTLLTIPFSFTYNGTSYTTLGISSNGFITMGSVPASSTIYCGLQAAGLNSIAGYGTDLVGASTGSTIIYGSRGVTPNRQFIIQWTDCDHYNNANANHWTFQIILNETSNTVQIVWGPTTDATTTGANSCADVSTESGNIGLLGGSTSDFNIRSVTIGTNTWATSTAGVALTAVCNMSSTNLPSAGLTYTWTPGAVLPMSYTSSTTSYLNSGAAVSRNTTGNQILKVSVVTSGTTSPFNLTSLTLSTTGCTNPATDITNAKIYFTGINNTFSSVTQFGSTANNPNGTYTFTGSATLSEGTNYFWITYDITANAGFGDNLSGCCTQIIGSGSMGTRIPAITCPAGTQTISQIGTWTPVASLAPHPSGGGMLLLSDGTVLCKSTGGGTDGYGNIYDKLTPNANGSYVNGTWSSIAPMVSTRLFYSSQILKDGRVYVAGGEYGAGLIKGEVYNPLTNTWTATANNPTGNVSDANSEILEDGRVLQALVAGSLTGTNIYNPVTNTYTTGPTAFGIHNESAWLKLQDNSILYVDRLTTSSERYIPATNTWVQDASLPVSLYDPFGDETGGALLLPDGRGFFLGALGHTAYYTPSGTISPGVWTAGPDIPGAQGTPDAPMAMMANGKIICTVSPIPTAANHFPSPTKFYEFDYLTNTFTQIGVPGGGTSLPISCYITNFLDLPDGTVLYSIQQNAGASQYYVYTPVGNPVASGKPTISAIKQTTCTTFKAFGTKFNGISQGASYGDDWQMSSNYPIIRLTSGANVYYTRTSNWNSTGVMRGNLPDSVQFTTPAGLPAGTYSLVVVANGISSDPVSFIQTPSLSSTLTPAGICSGNAFTYTPTSTTSGVTFTWTRAAVAGISNAAITTPQTSNPNEVLTNTTGSPISVVYAYTITGGTCSNTQNVTVVVNPASGTASTITAGGPITFCSGGSVLLSGNTTGGTWSIGGGTTSTLLATISGDYYVTNSSSCGVLISNHIIVTVNSLPTASVISAGGPTTFCSGGNVLLSGNSTGGTWSVVGGTAASVTATTAGDYFVTTSNSCGSTTSNHISVTVNSLPIASVISAGGPTTFCSGGNVLLSGNSTGGTWSVVGGTAASVTATTAGDYFVTSSNSCGSTTSNHISVTVNSLPTASVISAGGPTTFCSGGNVLLSGNSTGGTWSVGGGTNATLSATATGDYFVTTSNSCGSTTSNHISVTVNSLPTASVISAGGPTTFCSGGNVLLSGNTTGGTWSVGGGTTATLSATAAGDYFVTTSNSCGSTTSNHISVTVNSLPTASVISAGGPTTFCSGGNVLLSGNSTAGTWSVGGGTTATLSATATGDYFVTTSNSCGSTTSNHISVTVNSLPTASVISAGGPTTFCSGGNVLLIGNSTGGTWSVGGGTTATLSATATGDYFVTTSNSCGSTTSNHIAVTVNSLPTASVISAGGPTTFCSGGNVLLSGNSTGGTWSVGGGTTATLSATTAGDYFVTTSNSCGSTTSNHISVTVNPLPTASVISAGGPTTFCSGGNVLLTGNSTAGTWSVGGGTTATLSATATGDYFVTTSNSCGSTTSNHIAVTVNPLPTASVISAGGPTTFCSGGNVLLSGNSTGGTWSVGGGTTATLSATATGDYFVTTSNSCGSTTSNHISVTVNPLPTASVISAGGPTTFCSGGNVLLSGNTTGGTWSVGGGTTATLTATTAGDYFITTSNSCGSTTSNHITVTVNSLPTVNAGTYGPVSSGSAAFALNGTPSGGTFSGTGVVGGNSFDPSISGVGNFTVTYFYTDGNGCSNSNQTSISVTTSCNFTVGTITGPTNACPFMGTVGTSATYSIATTDASGFVWTVPVGATLLTGQGTGTISFKYPTTFVSGNVSVLVSSTCGSPVNQTLAITKSAPAIPAAILGPSSACPYRGNGIQVTYSIVPVADAVSYSWTLPTNVVLVSGQGTTGITVTFNTAYATGTFRVASVSGCGNSSNRTLSVSATAPGTPGTITGNAKACPGDVLTYSIVAVANATSYNWTAPTGATITSGQGSTIVSLTFDAGFIATGNLIVTATNGCGTSATRTKSLSRNTPATPSTIVGNAGGNCNSSGNYSVTPVSGMTYNWTAPTGATIISGQGSNAVGVTFGPSFVSGNLTVNASNNCSISANRSLALTAKPSIPTNITGLSSGVCIGSIQSYSTASVFGATTYTWAVPTGSTIQTGQGTTSVTVLIGSTGGNVSVKASNACGVSSNRNLAIAVVSCIKSEDQIVADKFFVSPNPCSNCFVNGVSDESELVVSDILGREIFVQYNHSGNGLFLIMPFESAAGLYIIRNIKTGQVAKFEKFQ